VGERISTASFETGSRTSRTSLKRESFSSVHAKLRAGTKDCGCGAGGEMNLYLGFGAATLPLPQALLTSHSPLQTLSRNLIAQADIKQ
jgi:hypothetical protein